MDVDDESERERERVRLQILKTSITELDVERWKRPDLTEECLDARDALEFETVDVKSTYVAPWQVRHVPQLQVEGEAQIPRISVYGVNAQGHSVCANIWNFHPYFYVRSPKKLREPTVIRRACDDLRARLEAHLDAQRRYSRVDWQRDRSEHEAMQEQEQFLTEATEDRGVKRSRTNDDCDYQQRRGPKLFKRSDPGPCVLSVLHEALTSGVDCHARSWSFFRVTLRTPNLVRKARDFIEGGIIVASAGHLDEVTYESNVVFENRFMIDRGITGAGWVRIAGGKYAVVREQDRHSTCQIEVDLDWRDITGLNVNDDANIEVYERFSKMRVVSYDIECKGRPGKFPDAKEDPVIQIAASGWTLGDAEAREECKVLFALGTCDPINGTRVVCAETEADLIDNFATFFHYYDPDIVTGYNTKGFDDAYLYDRATILGASRYLACGRDTETPVEKREDNRMSRNYGNRQGYNVNIVGRVGFDMLPFIRMNKKLRSYKLNAVSAAILGDQKEDLHHSMISVLQDGTSADRRRLGIYCVKDALLPKMLATKMLAIAEMVEFSRATGVQMRQIQDQGSSVKVMRNVLRRVRQRGLLMPYMPDQEKIEYEGANVFTPVSGFYDKPVVVLDFSALYPSIMIAHNICFSTRVPPEELHLFDKEDLEVCPEGHHYVKREKRMGVLTEVLEDLLAQRDVSKAKMKAAKVAGDSVRYDVYNCRQLAVKVLANSVYGWTGLSTSVYFWFCADSTTAYGREQIRLTKRLVETKFTKANGYPFDAQVIYGDTDSVMVFLDIPIDGDKLDRNTPDGKPVPSAATKAAIAVAIEYAKEIAAFCTQHFAKPNKLEFENVYWPYLLLDKKKRYAGPFWENAEAPSYTKIRGLESVRRDNCVAAVKAQTQALNYILDELDPQKAYDHVCNVLRDLRQGKTDLGDLVISQRLNARQNDITVRELKAIKEQAGKVYIRAQNWPLGANRTKAELKALEKAKNEAVKKVCEERGIYSSKLPHAEIDKRMREKTGMGYNIGDRVPYIIVDRGGGKNAKVYEKAEDPIVVLNKELQPDLEYYTEKIAECAAKVLAPVYEKRYQHQSIVGLLGGEENKDFVRGENAKKSLTKKIFGDETVTKLLHGPHMVKVRRHTTIASDNIFNKAFTPMAKCLGCHATIHSAIGKRCRPEEMPRVCEACQPDIFDIYMKELSVYRRLEVEFSRLWTQCQNCQEDYHHEISCNAMSCPIFFKRTVVKREFERQKEIMDWAGW